MKLSRSIAVLTIVLLSAAWAGSPAGAGLLGRKPAVKVPASVTASPTWAPAAQASIHPGVPTTTGSNQCTANFVFFDDIDNIYIGQAAHCAGTGLPNETNGCETGVLPLGTPVQIGGADATGQIVYNSWIAMQSAGEQDADLCFGNDFALVKIDPADYGSINPSIPFWGGPNGFDSSSSLGESVYAYGNSGLRLGISALSPQTGVAVTQTNGGWTHMVYVVTPGISGDSGSAYLGSNGGAMGVLSTISALGSNQVADLSRALSYMSAHSELGNVQLANGTEPFSPLL